MNSDYEIALDELRKIKKAKAVRSRESARQNFIERVDNGLFLPIDKITRPTVTTDAAAYYLNRKPQTLRAWATVVENPPISPVRIMGRLAWKVSDILKLLNGE